MSKEVTLPLPITIRGSIITGERVSGPPSKLFPLLRDLAEDTQYSVIAELDLMDSRVRGRIQGASGGGTFWVKTPVPVRQGESLVRRIPEDPETWSFGGDKMLSYKEIIAVRVLLVRGELPPLPSAA